ncbi:uncharacterized protein TrAFT101_000717 [Trichoderma asperellum]|uniref:uncharacterized protein n=1 Tax=Trichoderma asperellum TaxID=101201 RepID=UPI00331C2C61|nr:hypothetical protein TrAFT101_000717 [Trichoderma asperellum]
MAPISPSPAISSSPTATTTETSSTSSSTASTASNTRPEPESPLSLFGITRRHCREELFVSPVRWTGRHVELLHFSFTGPFPEPTTSASAEGTEGEYSEERSGTRHLKDFFDFYYKPVMREQGIWLLITTDACPLVIYEEPLRLAVGDSIVKSLHCMAFYLKDSIKGHKVHKLPVAALVDQGRIVELRKEYLGLSRCKQWCYWNRPMCCLYQKKWKKLTPPIPLHDPFITALLIGLAQKKRRYLHEIESTEEARTGKLFCQVVHTFNSRGRCKEKREEAYWGWLYLYQADIPSTLLDMFEQPKIAPPETPYIDIRITKVNYYPLATLRARLLELMLPGNAGATAAAEATASETAVWQTVAHNVATESMVELEHGVMAQEAMAQNMTQNMVATLAAPPAAITQTAMVQPNIDHAAMAQLAMDKGTTEQTCANQNGGQKRKFEDEHHDQPSQRWPPSVYLTPVNQIY